MLPESDSAGKREGPAPLTADQFADLVCARVEAIHELGAATQQDLIVVSRIVHEHLARFAARYSAARSLTRKRLTAETHTFFHWQSLLSLEDQVAKSASRSFDSQGGNNYQNIVRGIAAYRYGPRAPTLLCAPGVISLEPPQTAKSPDTLVHSNLDDALVQALAAELINNVKAKRCAPVGSDGFQAAFRNAIGRLHAAPKSSSIWETRVDLVILEADLGAAVFAEVKGGGSLDTAKLPGELIKLLRAALAYGHDETRISFCPLILHSADFRTYIDLEASPSALRGGDELLRWILPEGVSIADFETLMAAAIEVFAFKL